MNLLLNTIDRRDRKPNFVIFVVSSAVTLSRWVVLVLSRKSYLGPAEIASYVFLSNSTPPFPHSLKQVQETYEPGFEYQIFSVSTLAITSQATFSDHRS